MMIEKRKAPAFHCPRWEELPDMDLYMDQVVTLLNEYLKPFHAKDQEKMVTSTMINNYVKLKLIPKAEKKRYSRMHLAYLIAITVLKQVLTISEVKRGIEYQANLSGLKEAYNLFCEELELALMAVAKHIQEGKGSLRLEGITLQNTAMKMAAMSLAGKLVSRKILLLQDDYQNTL